MDIEEIKKILGLPLRGREPAPHIVNWTRRFDAGVASGVKIVRSNSGN